MSEQLWYTWSFNGLGRSNGLRVRAASKHLQEVEGKRVRSLISLIGYALPEASDQFLPPDQAPLSLAFLKAGTNQENVLMQKTYIGLDGQRRPGAFFSHLITDLPDVPSHSRSLPFSAYEAISLWHSSLWYDTEAGWPESKYDLLPIPSADLVSGVYGGSLSEQNVNRFSDLFGLVFRAFLTQGLSPDPKRLYLVGDPEVVAALIWGITRALPHTLPLMQRLTFSTFEANVENDAKPLIVGTCWQPDYIKKGYENSLQDLPAQYYQANNPYGITINCATLQHTPFPPPSELIAKYIRFVQECFIPGTQGMATLSFLREEAEKRDIRDIPIFLQHYVQYHEILKEEDVIDILTSLYNKALFILEQADLALTKDKLADALSIFNSLGTLLTEVEVVKRENVQRSIITLMIQKPAWWQNQGAKLVLLLYHLVRRSTKSQVTERGRYFTSLIINSKSWQKNQGADLSASLQPFSSSPNARPQELLASFTSTIEQRILETQLAIKDALLPLIKAIIEQLSQILRDDRQDSLPFWSQALDPYLGGSGVWMELWAHLLQTFSTEIRANTTSQSWLLSSQMKSLLTQLRFRVTDSDDTKLSRAFSTFASSLSQNLFITLSTDNKSNLPFWSELFNLISLPVRETQVWIAFLNQLGSLSYTMTYKYWYEDYGKASLGDFALLAKQPNSTLRQHLSSYLNAVSLSLQSTIQNNQDEAIAFWSTLLLQLAPLNDDTALWLSLFFLLRSHTASNGFFSWWKLQGQNMASSLRLLVEKKQIDSTQELLPFALESARQLANYIVTETRNNRHEYDDKITFFLQILITSVPTQDTQVWPTLLQNLAHAYAYNQMRWELRSSLLLQWKNVSVLTKSDAQAQAQIAPWLKVPWSELDALLALKLPENWSKIAINNALDTYSISSPDHVLKIVKSYTALFEDILQNLITTSLQSNAIAFFAFLAQQSYSRTLPLLDKLITACNYQKDTVDKLLKASQITTDQQVIELLEQYCHTLLTSYELPSMLLNFIQGYLSFFDPEKLVSSATRGLFVRLHNREQNPALRLPDALQQIVGSWYNIAIFLDKPNPTLQDLRSLTRLTSDMQQKLAARLIPQLVSLIVSEADLTRTLDALRPDNPLSLLQELVQGANEKYGRDELPIRLVPYVRMVLTESRHLAQDEREIFVNDCFLWLFKDVETQKRDPYLPELLWSEELMIDWKRAINLFEAYTNLKNEIYGRGYVPVIVKYYQHAFGQPHLEQYYLDKKLYLNEHEKQLVMLAKRFVAEYERGTDQNMLDAANKLGYDYTTRHYTQDQVNRLQLARKRLLPQASGSLPSLPNLTHSQGSSGMPGTRDMLGYPQQNSPYGNNHSSFLGSPYFQPVKLASPVPPAQTQEPPKIAASIDTLSISLNKYKSTCVVKKVYTQMKIQQTQWNIQRMEQNPTSTTKKAVAALQREVDERAKEIDDVTKFRQITLQELIYDLLIQDEIKIAMDRSAMNSPVDNRWYVQFNADIQAQTEATYETLRTSYIKDSPLNFNDPSHVPQIKQALQVITRMELFIKEFVKERDTTGIVGSVKERFKRVKVDYTLVEISALGKNILGR